MNTNTQYVAIFVIVIMIVAGASFVINNNSNDEPDDNSGGQVTITQNDGVKVVVTTPVTSVCVVNTSAAEFLSMVGLNDKVVGVSSSMISSPIESWWGERVDIGTYKTPNGEAILETGSTIVIGQCTSMPITNVEALRGLGITVILLDCFGYSTQVNDLKQLVSIFGDDNATLLADKYETFFNDIVDTIGSASSTIADDQKKTFVSTMGIDATSKYYTGASELSSMLNTCGMKNAITEINSSATSSSALINEESIVGYYNDNGINLFILRNTTSYEDGRANIQAFLSTHGVIRESGMFENINVIKTVDSKVLSGPRCFVSMIYFVSFMYPTLDINGLNIDDTISEYNELFGTNWSTENLFYEYN